MRRREGSSEERQGSGDYCCDLHCIYEEGYMGDVAFGMFLSGDFKCNGKCDELTMRENTR